MGNDKNNNSISPGEKDLDWTDEELFRAFLDGEENKFEVLVQRYESPLLNFIYKSIGNREKSEEIFQETFLRVFRFAHTFKEGKRFKTWLYTIALHLCRDEIKKKKVPPILSDLIGEGKEEELVTIVSPPDGELEGEELSQLVARALQSLSHKHREVLILHHFQGLKYEEIGEILNRKMGTVKSQIYYAVREFRKNIEPYLYPEEEKVKSQKKEDQ